MVIFYFQAVLNLFMLVPSLKMQVPRIFFMAPIWIIVSYSGLALSYSMGTESTFLVDFR